jgi:hypothetical protein
MTTRDRVLLSLLAIGALGAVAAAGIFGAFNATTTNSDNQFSTGTVVLGDNDSGTAMYQVTNAKPGDSVTRCIKVTYNGSIQSAVRLYMPDSVGPLAQYVNLTITPGTQPSSTFPDCTGFTAASGGAIYTGTLDNFSTTHSSYSTGVITNPGAQSSWNPNDAVVYRFQVSLDSNAPDAAEAEQTGAHSYVWEARSS